MKQRTQIINALRGHLAEFGIVTAKGPAHVAQLVRAVEDEAEPIPELARPILQGLIEMLQALDDRLLGSTARLLSGPRRMRRRGG